MSRGSLKGPIPDHCRVIVSFHSFQDLGSRTVNVRKCLLGLMARNRTTVAFEVFKRKTRMPSSNFACRTAVKLQV